MKISVLLMVCLLAQLTLFPPSALCQRDTVKFYDQGRLGFRIPYDDFDDDKSIAVPESLWVDHLIRQYQISIRLPRGYTIEKSTHDGGMKSQGVVVYDSSRSEAFSIYETSSDFYYILEYDFAPANDKFDPIDPQDTVEFQDAIKHKRWVSFGRQGMTEKATFLDGVEWKGVRGSNFTGYYTDKGYGGLQQFTSSILIRRIGNGNNLVCEYFSAQIPRNPISEVDFYNIVATIKLVK